MLRPVEQRDLTGIENLAADDESIRWGGLSYRTSEKITDRWRQPQITRSFIRVAESKGVLRGYSDIYQVSQKLVRSYGIAENLGVAESLVDWTCNKAVSQGMAVQTSLSAKENGRTLFTQISDHPLYLSLTNRGFTPFSTTKVMRYLNGSDLGRRTLPHSYRVVDFDATRLEALMATYYEAWPKDYYEGEDANEIIDIFRQANNEDLRLVISDIGDVVGYILLSRTPEHGVIDEVAVHPAHRRKGLGEALVNLAIRSFGDRKITLVLMDENPARHLYEKLGFVVHEERLDLICASR